MATIPQQTPWSAQDRLAAPDPDNPAAHIIEALPLALEPPGLQSEGLQ